MAGVALAEFAEEGLDRAHVEIELRLTVGEASEGPREHDPSHGLIVYRQEKSPVRPRSVIAGLDPAIHGGAGNLTASPS